MYHKRRPGSACYHESGGMLWVPLYAQEPSAMSDLPTGTVTFLFTDIEGSTKLWEQYPAAMPQVLARHDQLLQETITTQGGVIFKTVGDACYAAFPTATQALHAAIVGQQALLPKPWHQIGQLRVRM